MKKTIKKHSDKDFIYGISRYFCGELVIGSDSWEELFADLEEHQHSNFTKQSFDEYKLFNLTIMIEYKLVHILELFFNENKLDKNKAYIHVLNSCKKYRRLNNMDAKKVLKKEMGGNQSNIFSPHILFYVAGCSLGDILHIFDKYTDTFSQKDTIVKRLRGFKSKRNDFTHNLLSSRINQQKLLSRALSVGLKLVKTFEEMVGHSFVSGVSGRELVLKLNNLK